MILWRLGVGREAAKSVPELPTTRHVWDTAEQACLLQFNADIYTASGTQGSKSIKFKWTATPNPHKLIKKAFFTKLLRKVKGKVIPVLN
jgi:hypothetical protein